KVEQFFLNGHVDQRINEYFRVYGQVYANFKRREVGLENQITNQLENAIGKRRRIGAEARGLFTSHYVSVTLGGDVKFDDVNNANLLPSLKASDTNERIYGVFADAEVRPVPKLILGVGARYDYYDIPKVLWTQASSQVSPRASIVYHMIPQLSLRSNY